MMKRWQVWEISEGQQVQGPGTDWLFGGQGQASVTSSGSYIVNEQQHVEGDGGEPGSLGPCTMESKTLSFFKGERHWRVT